MLKSVKSSVLIISSLCISLFSTTSCNKDSSKSCTYYNKPLPVEVGLVGYYDYEIHQIDVHQFEKGTSFNTHIKSESINLSDLNVTFDTAYAVFSLNNKVDYMITLPQMNDTHYISDIGYKSEYFTIVEPSGKCDQQKAYTQLPDSATVNDERVPLHITATDKGSFYLSKP
jgi:hypothetical protein